MIVLDTHIVIWDALAPERLSAPARQAIAVGNEGDGVFIADISLWEIAMLLEKKRVEVEAQSQEFLNLILQANKTVVQPIAAEIASAAVGLPAEISRDPADRLIVATTLVLAGELVTADQNLRNSAVIPTIW